MLKYNDIINGHGRTHHRRVAIHGHAHGRYHSPDTRYNYHRVSSNRSTFRGLTCTIPRRSPLTAHTVAGALTHCAGGAGAPVALTSTTSRAGCHAGTPSTGARHGAIPPPGACGRALFRLPRTARLTVHGQRLTRSLVALPALSRRSLPRLPRARANIERAHSRYPPSTRARLQGVPAWLTYRREHRAGATAHSSPLTYARARTPGEPFPRLHLAHSPGAGRTHPLTSPPY